MIPVPQNQKTLAALRPREYQTDAIQRLREAIIRLKRLQRHPRILLVAPTGSGKSLIICWMILSALGRGKRVVVLVNRRELVKDLSRRLWKLGIEHGVIMGDHPSKPWLPVQVASIDTLHRREHVPPADLMFLDEAHFSVSDIWLKVIERYPDVPLIGSTATPCRADGRGLGDIYNEIVECPSVAELTEMGHLAPARIFAPTKPDLTGVKTQAGEYNQKQLAQAVDRGKLIGDIVDHWKRLALGRPTVLFAVNVQHSQHTTEQFTSAGYLWRHIDANTPDEIRDRTWAELADGSLDGISSVGVVSYGWDVPAVSCAILARPTKSLALYLQQVGRVLRPHPGKEYALVLDHAGCALEHGLPDDEREWTLEGAKKNAKQVDRDPALAVRMCTQCWCAFSSRLQTCPACGAVYVRKIEPIKTIDGELQEITGKRQPKLSDDPVRAYFQRIRAEKGHKAGFVHYRHSGFLEGTVSVPDSVEADWREYMRQTGRAHVIAERDERVGGYGAIVAAAQQAVAS